MFLYNARPQLGLAMMVATVGIKLAYEAMLPGMAYFNITALTILTGLAVVAAEAWARNRRGIRWREIWSAADRGVATSGVALAASLVILQIVFH